MGARKKKLTSEDRVLEHLKRTRCRHLTLVPGQYSKEYDEVVRNTKSLSELEKELGMPSSTLARAISELAIDENVLVYRFKKNGEYLPNENYDRKAHRSSSVRVAYRTNEQRYVGERLLEAAGGNLLAAGEILEHLSVSIDTPEVNDGNVRLHFSVGSALLNLTIGKGIFTATGARPVTFFLAQANALDISEHHFVPCSDHIKGFGNQAVILRLPTQALCLPSKYTSGPIIGDVSVPNFGNIALTFYPSGNEVWITQVFGLWSPTFGLLTEKHLARSKSTDGPTKVQPPHILNFDRWSRQARIWPEPLVKISAGQPPALERFFQDGDQERYTDGHGLEKVTSRKLSLPGFFDIRPWMNVHRLIYGEEDTPQPTQKQINLFQNEMNNRTWPCKVPALLGFRHFHVAITR